MENTNLLKLSHEDLLFRLNSALISNEPVKIMIKNIHDSSIGFKVKTNVTREYKVKPSHGILLPNEEREIEISAQLQDISEAIDCKHKFLIFGCVVPNDLQLNNFSAYASTISQTNPAVIVQNIKLKVSCIVDQSSSDVSESQKNSAICEQKEIISELDDSNEVTHFLNSGNKDYKNNIQQDNKDNNKEEKKEQGYKINPCPKNFIQKHGIMQSNDYINKENQNKEEIYEIRKETDKFESEPKIKNSLIQKSDDNTSSNTNKISKPFEISKNDKVEESLSKKSPIQLKMRLNSEEGININENLSQKEDKKMMKIEKSIIKNQGKELVTRNEYKKNEKGNMIISNSIVNDQQNEKIYESQNQDIENLNKLELKITKNKYNKLFEEYSKLLKENQYLQSEKKKLADAIQLKSLIKNTFAEKNSKKLISSTIKLSYVIIFCLISFCLGIFAGYLLK